MVQPQGEALAQAAQAKKASAGIVRRLPHGTIDEVRLSTGARYTIDFSPPSAQFDVDPDTIALWHFDELSGGTVFDATGQHDGRLGPQETPELNDPERVEVPCIGDLR